MAKIYEELTTKIEKPKKHKKRILNFTDSCFSLFVVSPLVVGFWKGLWNNIIHYDEVYGIFPVWQCLIISYFFSSSVYYARDYLEKFIIKGSDNQVDSVYTRSFKRAIIYRIYHYFFAFSSVMIWRCIWDIIPMFAGESTRIAVCVRTSVGNRIIT